MELSKDLIVPIVYIVGTILLSWVFNYFFKKILNSNVVSIRADITKYKFLRHFITGLIFLFGFIFVIQSVPEFKTLANSLLAGAGILAVAVGFASQEALGNIISGLFLVIFKPFKINDRVEIGNKFGVVEDITLRHTVIRNLENKRIILPNSIVSKEVIVNNDLIDEELCIHLVISISYFSDIDLAKSIIASEVEKQTLVIDKRTKADKKEGKPLALVKVVNLNESSVDLKTWIWAKDFNDGYELRFNLLEGIKKAFDKQGIVIPFPHRTIVQHQDLPK